MSQILDSDYTGGDLLEYVTAANGETVAPDSNGRLRDTAGMYGYWTRWAGAYVCYTCGHMCECGDDSE
jgi:hypothetical protein